MKYEILRHKIARVFWDIMRGRQKFRRGLSRNNEYQAGYWQGQMEALRSVRRLLTVERPAMHVKPEQLIRAVCAHYSVRRQDVLGSSRRSEFVAPRHVGMYLAVKMLNMSQMAAARLFCRYDHSTVIRAMQNVSRNRDMLSAVYRIETSLVVDNFVKKPSRSVKKSR